jgi:hypothetical protein
VTPAPANDYLGMSAIYTSTDVMYGFQGYAQICINTGDGSEVTSSSTYFCESNVKRAEKRGRESPSMFDFPHDMYVLSVIFEYFSG